MVKDLYSDYQRRAEISIYLSLIMVWWILSPFVLLSVSWKCQKFLRVTHEKVHYKINQNIRQNLFSDLNLATLICASVWIPNLKELDFKSRVSALSSAKKTAFFGIYQLDREGIFVQKLHKCLLYVIVMDSFSGTFRSLQPQDIQIILSSGLAVSTVLFTSSEVFSLPIWKNRNEKKYLCNWCLLPCGGYNKFPRTLS